MFKLPNKRDLEWGILAEASLLVSYITSTHQQPGAKHFVNKLSTLLFIVEK